MPLTHRRASIHLCAADSDWIPSRIAGPIFTDGVAPGSAAVDPVVQALMLTDVVVEATVVALLLAITVRIHRRTGTADPNRVDMMQG